ncbi:hotdog domain-containing protein [Anderseniella sp. Alg231-50]|uniref:hotdog domain-containing protein n=1 Tax=Anderseniella sp. Alg231-50 TaxID=1922226 RepID=UPI000D54FEFB
MNGLSPKTADYAQRVADSFARQAALATMGVRLVSVEPGMVVMEMAHDDRFTQQHGFIHAGVTTTVLDTACGYAAFSLMPEDAGVLTVELKTSLLAPAAGQTFMFEGRVIKPGRTITFCEGEAFALNNGSRKRIATLSATMMTVLGRDDVKS